MITVTITLKVTDPERLRRAALLQAMKEGDSEFNAADLSHCAQMLLDPGTMPGATIIESSVEAYAL